MTTPKKLPIHVQVPQSVRTFPAVVLTDASDPLFPLL